MKLYTYQEKCVEAILNSPSPSQLISMPTGTGKTITFLNALKRINRKSLVIVHRQELLNQTYEKALKIGFNSEDISIISSEKKEKLSKLNIAMIQSLNNILGDIDPGSIEVIVVDEAHHSLAQSYMRVFHYFEILRGDKILLGFTATPLRGDGKSLGSVFKDHVFKMTLQEATQQGYICPVHGLRINLKYDIENIENQGGDYSIKDLDKIVNCPELNEIVSEKCNAVMRLPCIVFCSTVDHANNIRDRLRNKGRRAETISYLNSRSECERILLDLRENKIDYLLNAVKLTEGFDHPPIQTIVIARPTRSPALYKQMIGRGLRLSANKFDCLVIEFSSNDPKMISWDQIDTSATFQCYTDKEKIDIEKAKNIYISKFRIGKVKVLDVRTSPFSFYECRLLRIEKYRKEFRYIPFDDGFCVYKICPVIHRSKVYGVSGFKCKAFMLCWKNKYKSFSCYSYGILWDTEFGYSLPEIEKQIRHYAENCVQNDGGTESSLGRWYPSEEEPMSPYQKLRLPNEKTNARRAEMIIEDKVICQCIDKFWIENQFPELDEDENGFVTDHRIFEL